MTVNQLPLAFKIPEKNMEVHYLGKMDVVCPGCGARFFKGENPPGQYGPFRRCCLWGTLRPHLFRDFPPFLKNLLTGWDNESKYFRALIREYSNSQVFASIISTHVHIPGPAWPYVYKICGQFFRTIHAAYPDDNKEKCFGHYWVFDPAEATNKRMQSEYSIRLDPQLLLRLARMELRYNPIAQCFRHIYSVSEKLLRDNPENPGVVRDYVLEFDPDMSHSRSRYSKPTGTDIAAVFNLSDGHIDCSKHIMVYLQGNRETRIPIYNDLVDAFLYPVLFPNAQRCYNFNNKHTGIINTHSQKQHSTRNHRRHREDGTRDTPR
jgi:hypothetical protein